MMKIRIVQHCAAISAKLSFRTTRYKSQYLSLLSFHARNMSPEKTWSLGI